MNEGGSILELSDIHLLVFQLDEAARCSLGPAVNAVHCPSVAADSS